MWGLKPLTGGALNEANHASECLDIDNVEIYWLTGKDNTTIDDFISHHVCV